MATTHIPFNRTNTPIGQELNRFLNDAGRIHSSASRLIAAMQHYIDGDGSDAAHFAALVSDGPFSTNALAKAAWDELNSFVAKITTDASVTNVDSAWKQMLAKFGIV